MEQPIQNPAGPPIDLKNTTGIKNSKGGSVFQQGVILRTVSKFITGTDEDALLPIPVDPILKTSPANSLAAPFIRLPAPLKAPTA